MQRHPASSHHRISLITAITIFLTNACAGPAQPSVSPAPTPSEVLPTSTPAPITSAKATAAWERIDLPDPAEGVFGGAVPTGIAELSGTYVAVGHINAACCADGDPADNQGVVWLSTDGRSWDVLDGLEALAGATVAGVVTDAGRLIAYGSADAAPAAWTSTDGRTWDRLEVPGVDTGAQPSFVVTTTADGLAAIVTQTEADGTQVSSVWHSAGGGAWEPALGPVDAAMADLIGLPNGTIVVVGARDAAPYPDGSHRSEAVAWTRAPDGTWSDATPLGDGGASAVATWDGRLVVAGNAGSLRADGTNAWTGTLWTSSDGLAWDGLDLPIDEEDTVRGVHVIGDSLLVTGDEIIEGAANAFVLTSTDGVTWNRIIAPGAFSGPNNEVTAMIETADGLLAIGRRWSAELQHPLPQAWIASR